MGFFAAAVACRFLAPAPVPELAFSALSAKRNPPFPSRRRGIVEFCPSRERRGPIQRWHGRAEARVRSEFFSSTAAPIGLRSTPTTAERKKTMPRATLPSPRGQLEHALNDPKTDDSHVVLLLVCSRGVRKGEGEGGKKGTVMEKNCDDEKKKIFLSLSLSVSLLFRPLLSASLSLPFLLLLLLVFSRKHAMREEGRHRRCGSGIGVLPNEG